MHTTDSQVIARCAVKHFATDGRRRRRIAVERDSNVRLSNLNVWEVNNITPDEQRLFFITQQITRGDSPRVLPFSIASVPDTTRERNDVPFLPPGVAFKLPDILL